MLEAAAAAIGAPPHVNRGHSRLEAAAAAIGAVVVSTVLVACGGSSTSTGGASGTVTGRVLSAPTCPVEQVGSPCPPRAVVGASVVATLGTTKVATTRTASGGTFTLHLAPGTYLVTATNVGGYRSTAAASVVVRRGGVARVTLTVDSGIR